MRYVALHHLWNVCTNWIWFGGVIDEKLPKAAPEIILSAATKTFEIWNLGNYKSDISETWPRYVTP